MRHRCLVVMLAAAAATFIGSHAASAEAQQRRAPQQRQAVPRRAAPPSRVIPPRYHAVPRTYYFPPVSLRVGYYYHPYFGFYYGPYYGPFYPYPGPYYGPVRYTASAIRMRVKPVETEVYLNGYYTGLVDDFDGVFQRLHVPAGEHEIELRLEGYRTFRQMLYVGPGDTFDVNHRMQPLDGGETSAPPPPPRPVPGEWIETSHAVAGDLSASPFGVLALRVEPTDAAVLIDDEAWAPPDGASELVIHLAAGWHRLEVRRDGYESFVTDLELTEGQITRLSVRLVE